MYILTDAQLPRFRHYLADAERAPATVEKYLRDITAFFRYAGKKAISKETLLAYKDALLRNHLPRSVNSSISAINTFLVFLGWQECRLQNIRLQNEIYADEEKELSAEEYERLCRIAEEQGNERLSLLMQTICSTGIRVSEVKFITAEALQKEKAEVRNKGKDRTVLLPHELCRRLIAYCRAKHIRSGPVFITRTGKPLDRSNIWSDMKKLCAAAGVAPEKVFPHNLRHLFARTCYHAQKDIVRLADLLGHSNINTTRIYTRESGEEHRRLLQSLPLLPPLAAQNPPGNKKNHIIRIM